MKPVPPVTSIFINLSLLRRGKAPRNRREMLLQYYLSERHFFVEALLAPAQQLLHALRGL